MTITRRSIRRLLYDQVPGLGLSGTADSLTTTTLTDAFVFADSTVATGHYRGMYIYRPDRSTDDRIKRITTHNVTTGAVSHGGTNYADTSDAVYEIVGLIHPDELNACITRAMKRIYYEMQVPLCGDVTDGDMESSATSSWTASASATISKVTTNVFSGTYSLRVLNSVANHYAQSATIRVTPNEPFFASAVCRADVGTGDLVVWDVTNAAVVGTNITSAQEQWQNIYQIGQVPATCEEIALRLRGTESNADIYWNHAMFYRTNQTFLVAPSWMDEQHKFLKLRECRYMAAAATNRNDAYSRTYDDWHQPSMFTLDPFLLETNPLQVQLKRQLPNHELWIEGKRPYVDTEPLTADTDTTHAPENLVVAYSRAELAHVLRRRYPADKRWEIMVNEADMDVAAQTMSRPETPMQPLRREEWVGHI